MLRSTAIINSLLFQCGDRLWTSDSDDYGRQILTSRHGLRPERIRLVFCDMDKQLITDFMWPILTFSSRD